MGIELYIHISTTIKDLIPSISMRLEVRGVLRRHRVRIHGWRFLTPRAVLDCRQQKSRSTRKRCYIESRTHLKRQCHAWTEYIFVEPQFATRNFPLSALFLIFVLIPDPDHDHEPGDEQATHWPGSAPETQDVACQHSPFAQSLEQRAAVGSKGTNIGPLAKRNEDHGSGRRPTFIPVLPHR